jgi:hypothetical protein
MYGASLQLCTERGARHRKVFERTDSDPPTFVAGSKAAGVYRCIEKNSTKCSNAAVSIGNNIFPNWNYEREGQFITCKAVSETRDR